MKPIMSNLPGVSSVRTYGQQKLKGCSGYIISVQLELSFSLDNQCFHTDFQTKAGFENTCEGQKREVYSMNESDELLMESLALILTDTGFLEYVREGTIAFVDKKLDDTNESQATLNYLLKQQKEYKYLQELAYQIGPESIDSDATYQDFVDNEKNLFEMIAFIREDKDVIDFMMGDASVDGDNYTEVVFELANFIKATQSTDAD